MKKIMILCLLGSVGSLPALAIKYENQEPETDVIFGMELEINNKIVEVLPLHTMKGVGQYNAPLGQNEINSIKASFPAGIHRGLVYFTAQADNGEVLYCSSRMGATPVLIQNYNATTLMAPFRNLTLEYNQGICKFSLH